MFSQNHGHAVTLRDGHSYGPWLESQLLHKSPGLDRRVADAVVRESFYGLGRLAIRAEPVFHRLHHQIGHQAHDFPDA